MSQVRIAGQACGFQFSHTVGLLKAEDGWMAPGGCDMCRQKQVGGHSSGPIAAERELAAGDRAQLDGLGDPHVQWDSGLAVRELTHDLLHPAEDMLTADTPVFQ